MNAYLNTQYERVSTEFMRHRRFVIGEVKKMLDEESLAHKKARDCFWLLCPTAHEKLEMWQMFHDIYRFDMAKLFPFDHSDDFSFATERLQSINTEMFEVLAVDHPEVAYTMEFRSWKDCLDVKRRFVVNESSVYQGQISRLQKDLNHARDYKDNPRFASRVTSLLKKVRQDIGTSPHS